VSRFLRRIVSRLRPVLQSDTQFIEEAYREVLGRPADQDGVDHYRRVLRDGLGRSAVLLSLMRSEEFIKTLRPSTPTLTSLRGIRPERYSETIDRSNGQTIAVFDAADPSDFDWLERMILEHKYYEHPGVWAIGVDFDKRTMAEILAAFAPQRLLELGCAAGAVLACLDDLGVEAEGVEISSLAIGLAPERVRSRIHHGDLLTLDLPAAYDVVFGLDVFEHLNPNRLAAYIARLWDISRQGSYLFCNIPAFGADSAFGTVFPLYVDSWAAEAAAGRAFSRLHVDELGYPIHGHLVWADCRWWVRQFEAQGFRREPGIEGAVHRKWDSYFDSRSPARKAFFVFSKQAAAGRDKAVIERIRAAV
jgi:SAM-dependent methyltransferase